MCNGVIIMEYRKKADLKVECIVSEADFEFLGATFNDVLDRTDAGMHFLKRVKELCGQTQGVEWTNTAYTLNITMLPDGRVSFEFSECIADYVVSLKHSMAMADEQTLGPLQEFIEALENSDEESARSLVAHFEQNIRKKAADALN